jgi:simple sugar transport system ATP-binding protein
VIVVTHKLDEVERYADVVTVMRRGAALATRPVARGAEVTRLSGEIIGGEPLPELRRRDPADGRGETRLSVRELARGRELRGVSLDVRSGEIVGIAGVLGNGQSELLMVLGGLLEKDGGTVTAEQLEVVHEDRQTAGLVLDATVAENLVLGSLHRFTRAGLVDDAAIAKEVAERIERFDIRPADGAVPVRTLSGGNQQKIVLARALASDPRVLVVAHPTRGVDLLAARAIHEQILAAASRGVAILLVTADLAELRLLSDRILVMVRGRVTTELSPKADDETLGAAMLAAEPASAA